MKRITLITVLLACGLLATSTPVFAQSATESPNWFTGKVNLLLLGRDDVDSSKFQEYREIPKGVSMPLFTLMGSSNGKDFALIGSNISRSDQRYTGWATFSWVGISFDYNQIPHDMGTDARTIHRETAPGVWSMSATLRKQLGDAVDAVPTSARNYNFYLPLLTPTIDAAGYEDLSALRQRGTYAFALGKKLPFDLTFTYVNDIKTGYRGASAGDILGAVTSSVDVLEPLDELTQDFGLTFAYKFKTGDVHAAFSRNVYNNRLNSLTVDNPFRATDLAYTSTSAPGGPAQARFSLSPDNEALRGAFGFMFKAAKQTRITGDLAFGQWTQDVPFLPYTINSAIFTPTGAPANAPSSLQQTSLNGKIDTQSYNFTFSSRPAEGLGVRVKYRYYGYKDKSSRYVITGDTSGSPDRIWTAANAPTEDEPYGHATANRTDSNTGRFDLQVSYDIADLTLEGAYRNVQSSWVGRTGSSGTDNEENGYTLAALYHTNDWLGFRFQFDQGNRTVSGIEAGSVAALQGVMADHAERKQTRTGLDIELTPSDKYGLTFAYFRRKDDYPNRPFEVAGDSTTESGLLEANYDMYSVDFNLNPSARAELTFFYTYEKVAETNQWVTLTSGALNNRLTYAPWDKGHSFGLSGVFQLVPDKWTLSLWAQHQRVDGFLDVTAREAGSFYTPGRTTLISLGQGGAADIDDYDDTEQTTAVLNLACDLSTSWTFSVGYAYDKYDFKDAFSDGTTIFPQSVLFFLKENNGPYEANIVFTKLNYRW